MVKSRDFDKAHLAHHIAKRHHPAPFYVKY